MRQSTVQSPLLCIVGYEIQKKQLLRVIHMKCKIRLCYLQNYNHILIVNRLLRVGQNIRHLPPQLLGVDNKGSVFELSFLSSQITCGWVIPTKSIMADKILLFVCLFLANGSCGCFYQIIIAFLSTNIVVRQCIFEALS